MGRRCLPYVPSLLTPPFCHGPSGPCTVKEYGVFRERKLTRQCSDIIFVEPGDKRLPPLNDSVCFNTTEFGFADVYHQVSKKGIVKDNDDDSGAVPALSSVARFGLVPALVGGLWFLL